MKLRSRSSRATGPKMRVPRGLLPAEMMTAAFSSNLIVAAVGASVFFGDAHDHRRDHLALLDGAVGRSLLDRGLDQVTDARPSACWQRP